MEWSIWITWWIIFCIKYSRLFWAYLKKAWKKANNPSIRIYINKKNRITFKINKGYYLQILMPETMKLLESTKSKITRDEIGENRPHLEITEVVLVNCNNVKNDHQQHSRVLYTFSPNKLIGQLLYISRKSFIFLKTFN